MVELYKGGAYLVYGTELIEDGPDAMAQINSIASNGAISKEEAKKNTIAYEILSKHNVSGNMEHLQIKFDKLTSHDITFVGIIQTARASGLTEFPIPYVLTNCHNSLCAVGGTINEDDHMFGLSCAKKYGGIYVPPHQAVIHQYAREMLAEGGKMILGSDSHTRYGALGTMAVGEGGGELVKQLLKKTYDVDMPEVVAVYLEGDIQPGVGPQDVALAIIGAVFKKGYVKNKVMEFVGPGIANMSADFRIGVDVMTTETTCLTSIWRTDEEIRNFYTVHDRSEDYEYLAPGDVTYYDGVVKVDLTTVKPMIAMPFHPSNVYTIDEVNSHLKDVIYDVEDKARISFGDDVAYSLRSKVRDGRLYCDQGIIAGCAGGGFENICEANDILRDYNIGSDAFTLNVYPASTPIYMELAKNGVLADLIGSGAIVKTAFCGPCFGAGDTPANGAFSIRHSTRNFPNREGSKVQNGQISSVALMDARSIAATAANKGFLTPADQMSTVLTHQKYFFDKTIYANRVYDGWGKPEPEAELQFGPNIKDWPSMEALPQNILLKVVSEIHDPVTTTDELIPSGETSSYRSNPLGLAEFTLSRKDPQYVPNAKAVRKLEEARIRGDKLEKENDQIKQVMAKVKKPFPGANLTNTGIGSAIFAVKPGDGSAREQAASCQKVLGGWANIANEYATKRYRSNLINWGMLPFLIEKGVLPFSKDDVIFIPDIADAIKEKKDNITAYLPLKKMKEFTLSLGNLTDDERKIILDGCLINYNRNN